ncbi:MAG: tetratricopeptide repeat protein [Deltaproteobacteria bacterium]
MLARRLAALGALLGALTACRQESPPPGARALGSAGGGSGVSGAAPAAAALLAAVTGSERAVPQQTTPGDVALGNLSDHIVALERRLEERGRDLSLRAELVDYLLSRTQFLSTFADFARAEELAEAAPREFPGNARALLLRARFRAAVHRFAEAESDLSSAEALGTPPKETELQRASLQVAQGRELQAALAVAERRAAALPALERLSVQALAEAALGRFDAADQHYRAALASYRDVSPFPLAFVEFQRGVMWAELANQPERAMPLYQEAVRLLPQYVVANVHLAELELRQGQRSPAEQRLRQMARQSEDPEPWSHLGELLLEAKSEDAEGRELIARARRRYEQLLGQQRSAFLDHGAEFFLGPGTDIARAIELSRDNLLLRQTGRAYQLALQAALAAGDSELFCQYRSAARTAAQANRNLNALIESQGQRCGSHASSRP